jgi:glycerophosphoryl diester phosphodiesterase
MCVADRPLLTIAHRAGNNAADMHAALDAGVDMVEADIHLYRDTLEVRHRKAIGQHLFWERWWELNRRRSIVLPEFGDLLAAVSDRPRLMLDLKGPDIAVAPQVAAELRRTAPDLEVTVCTKQWRMFDAFDGSPQVRRVFSASDPIQLSRLRARLRGERAFGLSIRRQLLNPAVVRELFRATDLIMVWPVDTEAALDHARRLGVNGVISKNLPMLRRLIAQRTPALDLLGS